MDEDRSNDVPVDVNTRPPSDLPEACDGTYDGDVRLTDFAERRLDDAEKALDDPDTIWYDNADDLLRALGRR